MDKVILKAVLSTVLGIVLLCGILVAALVLVYPSTLMTLAYDVGMDGASAWCAGRAYNQFDNVYYIAYATEVSIGLGDAEKIDRYGSRFVADEKFGEYCAQMDEDTAEIGGSYAKYIYGQVCVAKYSQGKRQEAVALAFSVNETGFPERNAAAAVLLNALVANSEVDEPFIADMLSRMREMLAAQEEAQTFPDADIEYLKSMIDLTQMRMDGLS